MGARVQMRVFTIRPGEMDAWVSEWRAKVRPLRERAGFRLLSAWTIPDRNQFVWFLSYDGTEPFETADKRYYESTARLGLDPDPARHVMEARSWFVTPLNVEPWGGSE